MGQSKGSTGRTIIVVLAKPLITKFGVNGDGKWENQGEVPMEKGLEGRNWKWKEWEGGNVPGTWKGWRVITSKGFSLGNDEGTLYIGEKEGSHTWKSRGEKGEILSAKLFLLRRENLRNGGGKKGNRGQNGIVIEIFFLVGKTPGNQRWK